MMTVFLSKVNKKVINISIAIRPFLVSSNMADDPNPSVSFSGPTGGGGGGLEYKKGRGARRLA